MLPRSRSLTGASSAPVAANAGGTRHTAATASNTAPTSVTLGAAVIATLTNATSAIAAPALRMVVSLPIACPDSPWLLRAPSIGRRGSRSNMAGIEARKAANTPEPAATATSSTETKRCAPIGNANVR